MAVAGLGAEGVTEVAEIHQIHRGYEDMEKAISSQGGKIQRV